MSRITTHRQARTRRHLRLRRRVKGTADRPRLSVFRSLNHIYVQVVDDTTGVTLAAASTLENSIVEEVKSNDKSAKSKKVGSTIAERAKEKGVTSVVFDRGGYRYHGRVQALAEGAREGGLVF